ncbi:MAG: SDR family NAD(P)-dependent oxidoreductase [Deltaproteobacteria bacterium]|nr:MAG: SDR family NAD(P)-dependent oxidoreductase [Deltaproteobacteria bacterium]
MARQRFSDQVVWITGGGSGIGRELALAFAREGAHVAVSGRRRERLDEVVTEIERLGRRGLAVPCDVTDEDSVHDAVTRVRDAFDRLDVAVANAGFGVAGRFEKLAVEDWRRQMDTNIIGLVATARAALPALRLTRGRLVLIGSVAGEVAMPGSIPYHSSKAAVRSIGLGLAMELHGSGVSCTTIQPGFVESEIGQVDNRGHHDPNRRDPRPRALMWRTEDAARVIVTATHRRRRLHTFTWHGKAIVLLARLSPGLVHFIITRAGGYSRQPDRADRADGDARDRNTG